MEIPRSLLREFQVLAKSVPKGTKFRNTLSACGGDRNFEDFASLLILYHQLIHGVTEAELHLEVQVGN